MPEERRRRRIVQLCGSSGGGVARHVREVARALAEHDEVLLAAPAAVLEGVARPVRGVQVEITDRPRASDQAVIRQLRTIAAGADLVHAHGLRAGALAALAIGSLGPRDRRPALVVTLHNLPVGGPQVRAVSTVLERLVAGRADAILGVSLDLVARMERLGAPIAERALVPAPVQRPAQRSRAEVRADLGVAEETPLLLTVARLAPQKGFDVLLEAAGLLDTDGGTPVEWLVAGEGPLRALLGDRIADEALPVRLLGGRSDVPDLLAAADLVVSTSEWEGQPLAVQEALAAGAVVVATDVGGTAEVTGEAAVLVPYQADAVAAAVRELLADGERRAGLSAAARAQAERLPRLPDVLAQLDALYTRVLG